MFKYMDVFKILRKTTVEQFEVEIFTEQSYVFISMKVKDPEQVLKVSSALVIIISIQRNEQNGRFKPIDLQKHGSEYTQWHAGSYMILRKGSMGHFRITIWATHLIKEFRSLPMRLCIIGY